MNEETVMFKIGCEMGEAVSSVQNALADKKVGLTEGIDIAKEIGTFGYVAVKNREALAAGFKDGLSDNELDDLKGGFVKGYDIESDELEATIESGFSAAMTIIDGVVSLFVEDDDE